MVDGEEGGTPRELSIIMIVGFNLSYLLLLFNVIVVVIVVGQ